MTFLSTTRPTTDIYKCVTFLICFSVFWWSLQMSHKYRFFFFSPSQELCPETKLDVWPLLFDTLLYFCTYVCIYLHVCISNAELWAHRNNLWNTGDIPTSFCRKPSSKCWDVLYVLTLNEPEPSLFFLAWNCCYSNSSSFFGCVQVQVLIIMKEEKKKFRQACMK